MHLRYEILKGLAVEYKITKNPELFQKILLRVDHLIVDTIKKMIETQKKLINIEQQDLYHFGVCGLHRALITFGKEDSGERLCARIISYIKSEIWTNYYRIMIKEKSNVSLTDDKYKSSKNLSVQNDEMFNELEKNEIIDLCALMLSEGVLTEENIEFIKQRFEEGMTYKEIGDLHNMSFISAKTRINRIIEKLRRRMKN